MALETSRSYLGCQVEEVIGLDDIFGESFNLNTCCFVVNSGNPRGAIIQCNSILASAFPVQIVGLGRQVLSRVLLSFGFFLGCLLICTLELSHLDTLEDLHGTRVVVCLVKDLLFDAATHFLLVFFGLF